ncbi:hypothetical protein F5Y05DRAFT_102364 [Hypoxylon sp. FL0543]|nr:hypothetical protein F5Y05DRAFT_102364 [Hypoxylon sp. FL0543]
MATRATGQLTLHWLVAVAIIRSVRKITVCTVIPFFLYFLPKLRHHAENSLHQALESIDKLRWWERNSLCQFGRKNLKAA